MTHNCSTETIAKVVREYEGVRRKHTIGEMVRALKIDAPHVVASFGEDAAVIEHNGEALLLAADGIWGRLMEADPYWAGYCSVLVNIHDIAAMGGHPIAMVDIFSIAKTTVQEQVVKGARESVRLTTNQYRAGIVSYLNVVTSQTIELTNEKTLISIDGQKMNASVLLVKALGGGWRRPDNKNGTKMLWENDSDD